MIRDSSLETDRKPEWYLVNSLSIKFLNCIWHFRPCLCTYLMNSRTYPTKFENLRLVTRPGDDRRWKPGRESGSNSGTDTWLWSTVWDRRAGCCRIHCLAKFVFFVWTRRWRRPAVNIGKIQHRCYQLIKFKFKHACSMVMVCDILPTILLNIQHHFYHSISPSPFPWHPFIIFDIGYWNLLKWCSIK